MSVHASVVCRLVCACIVGLLERCLGAVGREEDGRLVSLFHTRARVQEGIESGSPMAAFHHARRGLWREIPRSPLDLAPSMWYT